MFQFVCIITCTNLGWRLRFQPPPPPPPLPPNVRYNRKETTHHNRPKSVTVSRCQLLRLHHLAAQVQVLILLWTLDCLKKINISTKLIYNLSCCLISTVNIFEVHILCLTKLVQCESVNMCSWCLSFMAIFSVFKIVCAHMWMFEFPNWLKQKIQFN